MLNGHGGNIYETARRLGCNPADISDMSTNVNPLGPPPGLMPYLKDHLEAATVLPEVDSRNTAACFADFLQIDPRRILAGNGSTQFIYTVPQVFKTKKALIVGPTYSDYQDACRLYKIDPEFCLARARNNFTPDLKYLENSIADTNADTVFICNPNNPTGALIAQNELARICCAYPDTNFIIDESYLSFVDQGDPQSMIFANLKNVVVLLSVSKIFKIPGLRIGFIVAPPEMIAGFRRFLPPWNMNSIAQNALDYLTANKPLIDVFKEETSVFFKEQRNEFVATMQNTQELKLYPGSTPFILAELQAPLNAEHVCSCLATDRILIRNCANFNGLSDRFIRISLKSPEANRQLADKLLQILINSHMS